MTGGVLASAVPGSSAVKSCNYFVSSGFRVESDGKAVVKTCGSETEGRSVFGKRKSLRLHSTFTNAWQNSHKCLNLLLQRVPAASRRTGHHRRLFVNELGRQCPKSFADVHKVLLLTVDSEQNNLSARNAYEADVAEASGSSGEATGSSDAQFDINGYGASCASALVLDREPITGGAVDFHGATSPLTLKPVMATKKIVLVRHGLSAWNAENRIQGSSDLSVLSEEGIAQAEMCKEALKNLKFDSCFASPISRARTSAEVLWSGREEPLVFLDSLKEANLHFLEGMRNVDAKEQYPEQYRAWREDPMNFHIDGVFPVVNLWAQAKDAWVEILSAKGELTLVVTHKSILRALMCTALGMGPNKFRAVDINNGGISVFTVNIRGEALLQCLNMTAHLHTDGVYY